MALLVEPDLLLADEPTTALDATVEAQIVSLLEELRRGFAGSIVFISHHLGLVAQLCDDLCVMYGGTIVESGPVAEVLARPTPSVHARAARLRARRRGGGRPAGFDPRRGARSRRRAQCVRVRPALHACDRPLSPIVPALRDAGPSRLAACIRWEELAANAEREQDAIGPKALAPWGDGASAARGAIARTHSSSSRASASCSTGGCARSTTSRSPSARARSSGWSANPDRERARCAECSWGSRRRRRAR